MTAACQPQTDGQTERMNASMERYLGVFINHQWHNRVLWLPMAKSAVTHVTSDKTKCTPFSAIQGMDPCMTSLNESTKGQDDQILDTNHVQTTMELVHKHLQVHIQHGQAIQKEGATQTSTLALNIQEVPHVWLDA